MKRLLIILCCLVVAVASGTSRVSAADLSFPDWTAVFNADGTIKDLGGAIDAVYIQENISAGQATDMSAWDAAGRVVFNGTVSSRHDLGNSYTHAVRDALGNLIVTAAAERLNSNADTFIEFEFNQGVVGVDSGAPWPIVGARTDNDLLVRMDFKAGNIANVALKKWVGGTFADVHSGTPSGQAGCFVVSTVLDFCNGGPIDGLPPTNNDVWDDTFTVVQVPGADGFVQIKVNAGQGIEFTSIAVRTPVDIVLGSFQAMGYWGAHKGALAAQP